MNKILLACFLVISGNAYGAAYSTLTNFFPRHFSVVPTNSPSEIIKINWNTDGSSDNPGSIINIVNNSGVLLWTNQFGFLMPIDPAVPVDVPHMTVNGRFSVQPLSWGLSAGTNIVDVSFASQLYAVTAETNGVVLMLTDGNENVQHLEIFSFTNYPPFELGTFTLPSGSSLPGGGFVKLLKDTDWIGGNGRGIALRWIQPNWVELGRWDVTTGTIGLGDQFWTNNAGVLQPIDSSLPVAITNTVSANELLVYGTNPVSIQAAGPITVSGTTNQLGENGSAFTRNGIPIGESLWENNAGVLQPIDLTLQPMVQNGWFVGTNTAAWYGNPVLTNGSFISLHDVAS